MTKEEEEDEEDEIELLVEVDEMEQQIGWHTIVVLASQSSHKWTDMCVFNDWSVVARYLQNLSKLFEN